MSTTPRLLKDLAARAEKENGNGRPTNGAPKPLVITKGTKLTDAAKKVVKPAAKVVKAEEKQPRVTKMDAAKRIFKAMAGKGRKDILVALQRDAKLTEKGAATYYYLLLKKDG